MYTRSLGTPPPPNPQEPDNWLQRQTLLRQAAARGLPVMSAQSVEGNNALVLHTALDQRELQKRIPADKYQAIAQNLQPMMLCEPGSVMFPVVSAVYPDRPPDVSFVCLRAAEREWTQDDAHKGEKAVYFPGLPLNGLGNEDVSRPQVVDAARSGAAIGGVMGGMAGMALGFGLGLGVGYLVFHSRK